MIVSKINSEYTEIVDSLERITKFIIIRFESIELTTKDSLVRNFIAKSYSFLKSINILLTAGQEGEAHALYRLLVERYLYLEYLIKSDSFIEFSEWSYIKTFEIRNKMRGTPGFNDSDLKKALKDKKEQVYKYQIYKERSTWKKPDLKTVAKQMKIDFIYNIAYEQGSSHVHPRAGEGLVDAVRIVTNKTVEPDKKNALIHQSILISISILKLGLYNTDNNWGKFMEYYINSIFEFLKNEQELPELTRLENMAMTSQL